MKEDGEFFWLKMD